MPPELELLPVMLGLVASIKSDPEPQVLASNSIRSTSSFAFAKSVALTAVWRREIWSRIRHTVGS
jgi:hypothetical protein